MTSWDCFDTLVARRFFHPHSIFDEVSKKLNLPEFKKMRIWAEKKGDGTYTGIYKNLPGIDPLIEFNIELEHCFGIQENLNKLNDGDIIVSDMYFTPEQVKQILVSCGLKKEVNVIVTAGGKRAGWVWNTIPKPKLHIGDNELSDVISPKEHGINSFLYTGYKFNEIENYISQYDFNLACWSRYLRLRCPYQEDSFEKFIWLDQANLNNPVLALATLELPLDKNIAFTYRDSALWHKIYEAMTEKLGILFESSRECYYNPSDFYMKYVESILKDCLIVDLQGTGKSSNYFFKGKKDVLLIAGPAEPPTQFMVEKRSWSIEYHNITKYGRVIGWDINGPIRNDPDHDMRAVPIIEEINNIACSTVRNFDICPNKKLLQDLVFMMDKNFTNKNIRYKKN
jgi:predicted HAD superfamily hydrolase